MQGIVVMKFIRIFHRNKNLLYFNIAENRKSLIKKQKFVKILFEFIFQLNVNSFESQFQE